MTLPRQSSKLKYPIFGDNQRSHHVVSAFIEALFVQTCKASLLVEPPNSYAVIEPSGLEAAGSKFDIIGASFPQTTPEGKTLLSRHLASSSHPIRVRL